MTKLGFRLLDLNVGYPNRINYLSLYDRAGTLVSSNRSVSAGNTVVFDLGSDKGVLVPQDGTTILTVKITTFAVTSVDNTGQTFRVAVDETQFTEGVSAYDVATSINLSATDITVDTDNDLNNPNVRSNLYQIVKSVPVVSVLPKASQASGDVLVGGWGEQLRFSVSADQAGDIGLTRISIGMSISGIGMIGMPVIYAVNNGTLDLSNPVSENVTSVNGVYIFDLCDDEVVAAGSSKTYAMFANIENDANTGTSGDTASFSIVGDLFDTVRGDQQTMESFGYFFVWSDLSDFDHSEFSLDYFNGGRVPGLPTTPFTRFR